MPNDKTSSDTRPYAAAHFALELDGKKDVGLFRSIEGGGVRADVMTYQAGGDHARLRQLGKPKYEDIKLQVGMSMTHEFWDWLTAFVDGRGTRKNGAIVAADFYYRERARRTFSEGLLKELTFPKLDATDKNPAYLTVAMAVETMTFERGSGGEIQQPSKWVEQRAWKSCNFRMTLDGLGDACASVTKIDAFTIKQAIAEYHGGGRLEPIKVPTEVEFPNVTFYVPEASAQPFMDACARHFSSAAKGGVTGGVRTNLNTNGSIVVLDNTLKSEIFSISLSGVDIFSVTPDKADAGSEEIKLVKVEAYVEKMGFFFANGMLE